LKLSNGELTIKFSNIQDLENQLKNLDLQRIDYLLDSQTKFNSSDAKQTKETKSIVGDNVKELGTINLLKISERGHDATKLAIFLASNGLNHAEIKKITGITLFND